MIPSRNDGFTLLELMIVVSIIGILVAVAVPRYASMRAHTYDASMKSDLHAVFMQIEDYRLLNDALPPTSAALEAGTGFNLSPGVTWDKFDLEISDGILSIHMHLAHLQSPNDWHADYPAEGSNIEVR